MSEFDPYLKWLGIRESTRPINHYRLLGLDLYESDKEVISMAADRQMAHIRTYQNGPHGEQSQQILNELARARRCLLTAEQKSEYDRQLLELLAADGIDANPTDEAPLATPIAAVPIAAAVAEPVFAPQVEPAPRDVRVETDPRARTKAKKKERQQLVWSIGGWIFGGVTAVGVAAYLISSGLLPIGSHQDVKLADGTEDQFPTSPSVVADASDPPTSPTRPAQPSKVAEDQAATTRPAADRTTEVAKPTRPGPGAPKPEPPDSTNNRPAARPGLKLPPSSKWTLGNLPDYPQPDPITMTMLQSIGREVSKTATQRSGPLPDELPAVTFEDLPKAGAMLIGFRIWFTPNSVIVGLQPVYLCADGVIAGSRIGKQTAHDIDQIADPGFAVAGISLSRGRPLRAIQMEFEQVIETTAGSGERYQGPVAGDRRVPLESNSFAKGSLAIGCFGAHDQRIQFVGLIRAEASKMELAGTSPAMPDSFAADPASDGKFVKPAIPTAAALVQIQNDIENRYRMELQQAAKSANPGQRIPGIAAIADRLRRDASRTDDLVERYALLNRAMQMFATVGDAEQVIVALQMLDDDFQIEFWKLANEALNLTLPNVTAQNQEAFRRTIDNLIQLAVEQRQYDGAEDLIAGASRLASRIGSAPLKAWYKQQRDDTLEHRRLSESFEEARQTLADQPDDADAHADLGDYEFVLGDDLASALEHWNRSQPESSEFQLAELETTTDRQDLGQLQQLADAWLRLGKGKRSLKRLQALRRAYDLYGAAVKLADGPEKEKLESEMAEIQQQLAPIF